jgi:uncharacterized protein YdgA (DUF945 family)
MLALKIQQYLATLDDEVVRDDQMTERQAAEALLKDFSQFLQPSPTTTLQPQDC